MKSALDDLRVAVAFLTRFPMPHPDGATPPNLARAQRLFPIVGGAIGASIGVLMAGLTSLGLPAHGAAALALGAGMLLTGALHEDGLADVADGFGGGRDKPAKLAIMRDSRIGTYGTLALLVAFSAKLSALAAMPPAAVISSLAATHALARGVVPLLASRLPYARADGLAATAGAPDIAATLTAILLALAIALVTLPAAAACGAAACAALAAVAVAGLAKRQIGGQTGDVLGAAEQCAETAILLFLAARAA